MTDSFENNCPIRERTADGVSVGRCWHYCPKGVCPRHGDVSNELQIYQTTKRLSEDPKNTREERKYARVEQHVYKHRLARMALLIKDGAPPIVIYNEAKYIIAAWHPPLFERVKGWLLKIFWRYRSRLP